MEYIDNIDTSLLMAALGLFFAGLGVLLWGLARLLNVLPPTPSKHGLFGKKK